MGGYRRERVLSEKGGHVWKMLARLKNVAVGSALPAYEVAFGKHRAAFQLGQASGLRSLFKSSGTREMREGRGRNGSVASLPSFRSFFSSSPFFSLPHWFTSSNLPRLVLAPFKKRSCEEGAEMLIIFGINISWEKSYLKN